MKDSFDQIAVLAWVFLGEQITLSTIVGLAFAAVGVVLVNLKRTGRLGFKRHTRQGYSSKENHGGKTG